MCHECKFLTLDRVMRGFLTQVFPNTGRVLGLNKQQVSKQQYNFFCTKRTKNTKGGSPRTGLCLCLLGVRSWILAPGIAPVAFYLSCWGAGRTQLATRWPGLLHLRVACYVRPELRTRARVPVTSLKQGYQQSGGPQVTIIEQA